MKTKYLGSYGLHPKLSRQKNQFVFGKRDKVICNYGCGTDATSMNTQEIIDYSTMSSDIILGRAVTQWQFGDWNSLVKIKTVDIENHDDRDKIAILIAAAWFQLGKSQQGREFVKFAMDNGCSKQLVIQILISGVYQSIGVANQQLNNVEKAQRQFKKSIEIGAPYADADLIIKGRFNLINKG